jgi:hypothetical protein
MPSSAIDRSQENNTVFISYAREDLAAARRLYEDLMRAGFNPWLDKKKLSQARIGKKKLKML